MSKFSPLLLALAIVGCRNEPADIRPAGIEGSEVAAPAAAPASSSPAAIGRNEAAASTPEPTSVDERPANRAAMEGAVEETKTLVLISLIAHVVLSLASFARVGCAFSPVVVFS